MTEKEIELNGEYFDWMCDLVNDDDFSQGNNYRRLLYFLHMVDFAYTIPRDENREADGINLRYRFGYDHSHSEAVVAALLDNKPCSILEMMVALAVRCEEHIMSDPDIGDRTGVWFWEMIESLGLKDMTNENFDRDYVQNVIDRFLNHTYRRNGRGGLFTVKNRIRDMRNAEIWYQMCWYLDELA